MYYSYEVTTTQKCDMACSYCFEGEELKNTTKQRSTADIIKSIYNLLNNKKFNEIYKGIKIVFWGGEPTQNSKMIIQLINEFKDVENIRFFMYTNGFNRYNIEKIINNYNLFIQDKSRFSYQISYDGITHDKERIDHKGNGTSVQILNNIRYLKNKFPDIQLSLKSTIMVDDLLNIVEQWNHFKDLIEEFPSFYWSPTLEYTNKYLLTKAFIKKVNDNFLIIAKKEIEYYKENNRFVWSWFGTGDHYLCSAGMNMSNVDIDGNILLCHGAIYSDNKDDFIIGNIKDDVNNVILSSHEKHKKLMNLPDYCKGCLATVCYQCPIVNYDHSKKESYDDKFHDPKKDLCEIYKAFGKIDRTVQKYLNYKD